MQNLGLGRRNPIEKYGSWAFEPKTSPVKEFMDDIGSGADSLASKLTGEKQTGFGEFTSGLGSLVPQTPVGQAISFFNPIAGVIVDQAMREGTGTLHGVPYEGGRLTDVETVMGPNGYSYGLLDGVGYELTPEEQQIYGSPLSYGPGFHDANYNWNNKANFPTQVSALSEREARDERMKTSSISAPGLLGKIYGHSDNPLMQDITGFILNSWGMEGPWNDVNHVGNLTGESGSDSSDGNNSSNQSDYSNVSWDNMTEEEASSWDSF